MMATPSLNMRPRINAGSVIGISTAEMTPGRLRTRSKS